MDSYFLLDNYQSYQGSRKNNFTILGVETPGWQGAKALGYQAYTGLRPSRIRRTGRG